MLNCNEGTAWRNWHYNVNFIPNQVCKPRGFSEVVEIVNHANRQNRKVRAVGGGLSANDMTASPDIIVDTSRIRGILAFSQGRDVWGHKIPTDPIDRRQPGSDVLIGALKDSVLDDSNRKLAHVLAGTTIRDLYMALDHPAGNYSGVPPAGEPIQAHWQVQGGRYISSGDSPASSERQRGPWALITKVNPSFQTLAGAIGTGSHSGDYNLPPIADQILAIQLIAPDGSQHWIERAGDNYYGSITDSDRLYNVGLRGAVPRENIHYDNDWFSAVLVSAGRMGIIYSLIIQVVEQYGLSYTHARTTWNSIKPYLLTGDIFTTTQFRPDSAVLPSRWIELHESATSREVRGLSIIINPYRISDDNTSGDPNPDRHVHLFSSMGTNDFGSEYEWDYDDYLAMSNSGLDGRTGWGRVGRHPRAALEYFLDRRESTHLTEGRYFKSYTVTDPVSIRRDSQFPSHRIFLNMEMAITTQGSKHVEFIDRLLEVFDGLVANFAHPRPFGGIFRLSFTRPTAAYLGMQSVSDPALFWENPRICHIEILALKHLVGSHIDQWGDQGGHGSMFHYTEQFIRHFQEAAQAYGARMHWGQIHRLNRARVESDYADTLPRWRKVLTQLVSSGEGDAFSSPSSKRCGLEPYSEVLAACSWGPNRYDVFSFNERGEVQQLWWDGTAPWKWANLGNHFEHGKRFIGPLTATSWGPNRIDVFGMGNDGWILHLWWDGRRWHWDRLPVVIGDLIFEINLDLLRPFFHPAENVLDPPPADSPPNRPFSGSLAATAVGPDRIELFALKEGGVVSRFWKNRDGWQAGYDLSNEFPDGQRFTGSITAVSNGPNQIHLFGMGLKGQLLQVWREGDEGSAWNWANLSDNYDALRRFWCSLRQGDWECGIIPCMRKPIFVRKLTPDERQTLETGLHSSDTYTLRRSQILLASARGQWAPEIAHHLGCHEQTVRNAIHEFNCNGLVTLRPGSSRPHRIQVAFDEVEVERLRALLHQSPRSFGKPTSVWTLDLAAEVAFAEGLSASQVSGETIRATLARLGVKWRRAKRWITSPDPAYALKKTNETG